MSNDRKLDTIMPVDNGQPFDPSTGSGRGKAQDRLTATKNGTAPPEQLPALLSPRQRQRLAEDEIEAVEKKYNVRILGVVKTVNGGQQVITWEAAPLPDNEQESG